MNRISNYKFHVRDPWTGNVEPLPPAEYEQLMQAKKRQEQMARDKMHYARGHEDGYATAWVHAVICSGIALLIARWWWTL